MSECQACKDLHDVWDDEFGPPSTCGDCAKKLEDKGRAAGLREGADLITRVRCRTWTLEEAGRQLRAQAEAVEKGGEEEPVDCPIHGEHEGPDCPRC